MPGVSLLAALSLSILSRRSQVIILVVFILFAGYQLWQAHTKNSESDQVVRIGQSIQHVNTGTVVVLNSFPQATYYMPSGVPVLNHYGLDVKNTLNVARAQFSKQLFDRIILLPPFLIGDNFTGDNWSRLLTVMDKLAEQHGYQRISANQDIIIWHE